ncbi:MAG: hypothetical protein IAE94_13140 [Chthoniobacterales bacterium]|nr:hypothetical protein [Chthoniobacterales bacterium]
MKEDQPLPGNQPRVILLLGQNYKEQECEAARAFALMLNTQDIKHLAPHLTESTVIESQHVMTPLVGKEAIISLWTEKLLNIKANGFRWIRAELAFLKQNGQPCLIVQQGEERNAVILFKVDKGKIARIDICGILPTPDDAEGTGEFPGF